VACSKIDGYRYPSTDRLKFNSKAEAEMESQRLNKISSGMRWEVVFDDKAKLVA
jgi:hypothetical protein